MKRAKAAKKEAAKLARERRNAAFKHNVAKFGLERAKMIAALVSKKKRGEWIFTPADVDKMLRFKSK